MNIPRLDEVVIYDFIYRGQQLLGWRHTVCHDGRQGGIYMQQTAALETLVHEEMSP
jgi:hypothetical protein